MDVALRPVRDLDEDQLARWRALAATALEPNPFFDPAMAVAAAKLLPGGEEDLLLTVADGARLRLALPLRRRRAYRRVPVPTLVGWGHTHSYLATPLLAAEQAGPALAAALDHLAGPAGAGLLVLEALPADGPVAEALTGALSRRGARTGSILPFERPVLHRRPGGTDAQEPLSASRRKRLRRGRRQLGEELGGELRTTEVAGTAEGLDRGVEAFMALEATGWKGRAGTALAARPAEAAFFREAMTRFAAEDRARVWILGAGETPVAAACAVVAGGGLFHLKIAHDEAHARSSPGMLLELDLLEAFDAEPGLDWIDSCTAGGPSPSERLYPDRRPMHTLLVALRGGRGALAVRALPAAMRLRRRSAR